MVEDKKRFLTWELLLLGCTLVFCFVWLFLMNFFLTIHSRGRTNPGCVSVDVPQSKGGGGGLYGVGAPQSWGGWAIEGLGESCLGGGGGDSISVGLGASPGARDKYPI